MAPRVRPETQHLPIGFSDESYRTSRRWFAAALFVAMVLAAGIVAAILQPWS